ADKAEIGNLLDIRIGIAPAPLEALRPHQISILAGDTDCLAALRIDRCDDLLVDRSGQHHLDHLDGLAVGHAQAALELAPDVEPGEQRAELRATATHHNAIHAS